MNRQQFSDFVKHPGITDAQSLKVLEDLVKRYPYCQTAQLLFTFNLAKEEDLQFHNQLKKAAAYATDRRRLKELLDNTKEKSVAVIPEEKITQEITIPEELTEHSITSSLEIQTSSPEEDIPFNDIGAVDSEVLPEIPFPLAPSSYIEKPVSPERMTREELLAIVRKRLAEITSEKQQTVSDGADDSSKHPGITPETRPSKESLIDKFIREEPKITRPKTAFFSAAESAIRSNVDDEEIVSETLALLYAKQGNNQKAIHIYQKLSLRNQEKSRYFAARIQELSSGH